MDCNWEFTSKEEYDKDVCYITLSVHRKHIIWSNYGCTTKKDKQIDRITLTLHNLPYSDDTVLLAETGQYMQEQLNELEQHRKNV